MVEYIVVVILHRTKAILKVDLKMFQLARTMGYDGTQIAQNIEMPAALWLRIKLSLNLDL
jgi:ABC-type nitrate/sulfonate/bicarbonate transport system permease component